MNFYLFKSYPAPIVYFDTREVAASTVPSQISSIASSIPSTQASTQTPTESLTGSPTESPTESPAETVSPTEGSTQTGTTSTVSILTTTNPNGASRHCGSLGVILITVYISLRMFFQNC